MKIYINCPKCDDEFEFHLLIESDGAILIHDEIQGCNCVFSEREMDALRSDACEAVSCG